MLNVATIDGCLHEGALGEYVVLKPTDKKIVYAMGFVPSYANWSSGSTQAKMRMIKADYIFAPYRPTHAILTGSADSIMTALAWVYVVLRIVHAAIHTTYNKVLHRFLVYLVSNIVLIVMWVKFAVHVLAAGGPA